MQEKKEHMPRCAGLRVAGVPVFIGLLAVSATVHAQPPWSVHPTFSVRAGVHDNVNLREDDKGTTYEGSVSVGAILEQVSEVHQLRATGIVGYRGFGGDTDATDDGDFQSLLGEAGYRTERTTSRVTLALDRDFTRADIAVPTDEVDPGADIDTVRVEEFVRRYRARLNPSIDRSLTERWSVGAAYTGLYLDYDEEDVTRTGVVNHEVNARSGYSLTEITTVGLGAHGGFFRPRGTTGDRRGVDTYALIADLQHEFTELSTLRMTGGVRRSEPRGSGDIDDDTGFLGSIEGTTRGQRWRGTATVERRLLPSSAGVLRETDQIRLRASRELSPRLGAALSARAFKTRRLGRTGDDESTQEYASLLPSVTYMLTPEWSVTGEYRFEYIDRSEREGNARGHAVFVSIDFRPRREAVGF